MALIEQNRSNKIEGIAKKMNYHFISKDEFGLINLLQDFKLFKKGYKRRIYNLMRQDKGATSIYLFDYDYKMAQNKSQKAKRQTVLFIKSKELGLPQFSMRPENVADKLLQWLGMEDIDFDQHLLFSKKYLLTGTEEEIIRYYFTTQVLDFLSLQDQWHVEGINYFLVLYSLHEQFHPDVLPGFIQFGRHLHDLFAKHTMSFD